MNDPTDVTNSWLKGYLKGIYEGGAYTGTVILLSLSSAWLFLNTAEGILELCTCFGLLIIDITTLTSEVSMRRKSRKLRAANFVGDVTYKDESGTWKQKPGINLQVGDIVKLTTGSVVPADVKWLKGSTFLCETTFALSGDHRFGGGVGGDSGEDLSGVVQFGPPLMAGNLKENENVSMTQRIVKTPTKKTEVVNGVVIEDDSSDSDNDIKMMNTETKKPKNDSPSFPIDSELAAGAMLLTVSSSTNNSTKDFAECQVLRIGANSIGWQRAAEKSEFANQLRFSKRSKASPTALPNSVMILVAVVILVSIPYFLNQRTDKHAASPAWSTLGSSLYIALRDQIAGLFTMTEEQGAHGIDSKTRLVSLASLIAIDQCKALLHLGLGMLCYGCIGSRLLLQSCESTAQQYLAKRGALLKPKYSGCTVQRLAEVDTVLLTHCSPRGICKEDAAAIHRLKLIGLDIKILSATSAQLNSKMKQAAALSHNVVSPAEFVSAGQALSAVLKSVGLVEDVVMVKEKDKTISAGGILVALEGDEAKDHAEGLLAGAKRVAVWEAACEERRKLGPMKVAPIPRPTVDPLPRSAVAAAISVVDEFHLHQNRCVLVTTDDAEDGRTLPLLSSAHVGVVCGNTFLTKSRKKSNQASSSDDTKNNKKVDKKTVKEEARKKKQQDLFGDVGDVSLMTGMPIGLSPVADLLTVSIATSCLEQVAQTCRAATMIASSVFLFSQILRASWLTTSSTAMSGLEAGAVWESSVIRRSVVFGGALRVPLAMLIGDVVALFVLTPPAPEQQRGQTDQILNASLSTCSSNIGASRRLSPWKQRLVLFVLSAFSVFGVLLFQLHMLPYVIPKMLPSIREYLEGTDLIFGSPTSEEQSSNHTAQYPSEMNEIDRDLCSFLFLIYAIVMATLGALSMSKALWRTRLSSPFIVIGLPISFVTLLALGTNGMLGGVNGGGDPASGIATLIFAFGYYFFGSIFIFFLVPPFF